MINKVIKLELQCFKHVYVQATCQRDPVVYATCHDPKIYPHTKFGIPTPNYIQICSGLDLYLHSKYGTATINNIGDLLWVHFSRPDS